MRWPNHVLGNHDEARVASRFGERRAGLAAILLLTLRGTVTMYYGDEIGMPEVVIPPGEIRDPQGIRLGTPTRDGCRTPMQWDDQTHAGFSPREAPGTWLPLSTDWRERNVSRQLDEPGSLLQLYRRLLAARRSPSLRWGGFSLLPRHRDVWSIEGPLRGRLRWWWRSTWVRSRLQSNCRQGRCSSPPTEAARGSW